MAHELCALESQNFIMIHACVCVRSGVPLSHSRLFDSFDHVVHVCTFSLGGENMHASRCVHYNGRSQQINKSILAHDFCINLQQ
jgi:hypothetical protein